MTQTPELTPREALIESLAQGVERYHEAHVTAYSINRVKTYGWKLPEGSTGQENEPVSMEASIQASDAFDSSLREALAHAFDTGKRAGQATPCLHQIAEPAAAPQAVQAAVPATNHSETPNSSTIIVPCGWKLVPDDATPEWVTNLKALPDWREAVGECIKRFLAAAPAHPAEGVLSYVLEDDGGETLLDGCESRFTIRRADGEGLAWVMPCGKDSGEAVAREIVAALNATHPSQQELDKKELGQRVATLWVEESGVLDFEVLPPCTLPAGEYPLHIAAQTKQGGAQP